jgi:hypothetical protein
MTRGLAPMARRIPKLWSVGIFRLRQLLRRPSLLFQHWFLSSQVSFSGLFQQLVPRGWIRYTKEFQQELIQKILSDMK